MGFDKMSQNTDTDISTSVFKTEIKLKKKKEKKKTNEKQKALDTCLQHELCGKECSNQTCSKIVMILIIWEYSPEHDEKLQHCYCTENKPYR